MTEIGFCAVRWRCGVNRFDGPTVFARHFRHQASTFYCSFSQIVTSSLRSGPLAISCIRFCPSSAHLDIGVSQLHSSVVVSDFVRPSCYIRRVRRHASRNPVRPRCGFSTTEWNVVLHDWNLTMIDRKIFDEQRETYFFLVSGLRHQM